MVYKTKINIANVNLLHFENRQFEFGFGFCSYLVNTNEYVLSSVWILLSGIG